MEDLESASALIGELYRLHEERDYTLNLFDEGHKIYLTTAPHYDLPKFRLLVVDVTQELKRISAGVVAVEKKLRSIDAEVADIVRSLEEAEKLKLRLIARLQLSKQEAVDDPRDGQKWADVAQMKAQLRVLEKQINQNRHDIRFETVDL